MGELTDKILKVLQPKNPKSLKQVREILETSEEDILGEIILNVLNTLIEHIEVSDKPTSLEIYIWLLKQKEELLTKEEEQKE